MPSIYDIKPAFQRLLRPLVRGLGRAGLTANQVTLAALALSIGGGAALAWWPGHTGPLFALPALLFVRMALNAIDGLMARELDQASPLGALLNELGDVLSDTALYLPLALHPELPAGAVATAVALAAASELAGVLPQTLGGPRRYDGPMGKSDRAFVFGALALALAFGARFGAWADLLWLVPALILWTIVNRCRSGLRAVASEPTTEEIHP